MSRKGFATGLGWLLALTVASPVLAQQSAGLGEAFPAGVPDLSLAPGWHVYRFDRDGVRYIQVNDAGGTVLAAVAAANGQLLRLPLGVDADHVSIPQSGGSPISSTTPAVKIYDDGAVQISTAKQDDGTTLVSAACNGPFECGGSKQQP